MERFVGTDGVHRIGHCIDVPVIGFDALVENFGATALLADDGRYTALHGFKRGYSERFGNRWHYVDIAVAEGLINLFAFHESREMELVGYSTLCGKFDHVVHHVSRSGHAETDVVCAAQNECGGFHEILGAFLHGDASQESHHLFVVVLFCASFVYYFLNFGGQRIDGIVHRDTFRRILVIVVDDGLAGQLTDTHDAVCMVHSVFFDAVYGWVHISAATVEIRCMDVDDKRLSRYILGVYPCWIGEPVVGMDDLVFLLTCYDTGHNGVVVDLFVQIVGITARELYTAQIVGGTVVEIRIDVVTEGEILLGRHFISDTLVHIFTGYVSPYYRCLAQTDDVHETLVFVAPGFGYAEGDVHVGLFGQTCGDTVTGSSESAQNMRRELPSEH